MELHHRRSVNPDPTSKTPKLTQIIQSSLLLLDLLLFDGLGHVPVSL